MKNLRRIFLAICLILAWSATTWAQSAENLRALSFISSLSTRVVGRPLNANEISVLKTSGTAAFASIVNGWAKEPGFAKSMQIFMDNLLGVSGNSANGDFNLPGYLAKDIAAKRRPYSDLLTATSCVNENGSPIPCDTQAPFTAGVLTTRAFLTTYKGAYNIARASKMLKKFTCSSYPLADNEEPKLTEAELIAQFATHSGAITFGNGNDCYSCHSQFGLHAQFFVKFDTNGLYRAGATGLQNPSPSVTDGYSTDGTYTSHLKDATRARSESSRIFGKPAQNLAQAASVIVKSPRFLSCATQNMSKYFLRLSEADASKIHPALYEQMSAQAQRLSRQPSFAELLLAIITNPHVYNSFAKTGAQP